MKGRRGRVRRGGEGWEGRGRKGGKEKGFAGPL